MKDLKIYNIVHANAVKMISLQDFLSDKRATGRWEKMGNIDNLLSKKE